MNSALAAPGPPERWDMSTRLMNRQYTSTAKLSSTGVYSAEPTEDML